MVKSDQSELLSEPSEDSWEISHNNEYYWIKGWGGDYFDINSKGHVTVSPDRGEKSVDLYEIVKVLVERGIEVPVLLRFDGIIKDRIKHLYDAFQSAIEEFDYKNHYQLVYPIKVNQQRHVVDVIRKNGSHHPLGFEVGSKPELVAILSVHDVKGTPLLCNGYKDREYIELALLARKIGRRSIVIVEQFYELDLILKIADELKIEAEIGFRMKPTAKGSGKWACSSGELAKFGLSSYEILMGVKTLKDAGKAHWLKLLHFHIGSQVTSITSLKKALNEAARVYVELAKLCGSMEFFDVGGGLGVDYDGSQTTSDSSMNYTIEEYARDVVYAISSNCKEHGISEPIIISESGRAIVAHHSVLITEVISVSSYSNPTIQIDQAKKHEYKTLQDMVDLCENVNPDNCHEALNDAHFLRENAIHYFIQGEISLEERAYVEKMYYVLLHKIRKISKEMDFIPEDIEKLDEKFLDIFFCNFSVFQSLPDFWAIDQLFPVMPIHRLDECPTRNGIIADLSCDSDGKIDQFVNPNICRNSLALHEPNHNPYYLGIFLVGAYQEILGGLHNLFGDANVVHVDFDAQGNWVFKHDIEGDTINDVLRYVQYDTADLIERLRLAIEDALKEGNLGNEESARLKKRYKQALESYTYLIA